MSPLRASEYPPPRVPSFHQDSQSNRVLGQDDLEQTASRHEPHSFIVGARPTDPYLAWLSGRDAELAPAAEAGPGKRAGRLTGNDPAKAPWEMILVKLTGGIR